MSIISAWCYQDIPAAPEGSTSRHVKDKEEHSIGQEIKYECEAGYEFKTAVSVATGGKSNIKKY